MNFIRRGKWTQHSACMNIFEQFLESLMRKTTNNMVGNESSMTSLCIALGFSQSGASSIRLCCGMSGVDVFRRQNNFHSGFTSGFSEIESNDLTRTIISDSARILISCQTLDKPIQINVPFEFNMNNS